VEILPKWLAVSAHLISSSDVKAEDECDNGDAEKCNAEENGENIANGDDQDDDGDLDIFEYEEDIIFFEDVDIPESNTTGKKIESMQPKIALPKAEVAESETLPSD
jgi:hypothetical protein